DTGVKDPSELRRDDIITYWTVINGERVLNTHRVHEIYDGGGYLIFSTKGDNNTSADPLTVHESEIVGKYSFRVPGVGKVFDYLQTSTGFLIVIVIPVFLFFLFHLVQFFRVLFEYQNVKNRIKFEQERGRTEDLIDQEQKRQSEAQAAARAKMEEEIRERLRAEIMASMAAQAAAAPAPAPAEPAPAPAPKEEPAPAVTEEKPAEEPAEEAPAEAEVPAEEVTAEEAPVEEAPAEEIVAEEVPEEEPAEEKTEETAEV
ncbi:MAG: signal peptidase I, partial [Oscillospiraceae bacterium]|nr:signal peptidase I [Oscillospiraceae bacterium]